MGECPPARISRAHGVGHQAPDGSGRLLPGGPFAADDPGAGIANVIDERGRVGGAWGATLSDQGFAAVWAGGARRLLRFGGNSGFISGANDDGDFVGSANAEPGGVKSRSADSRRRFCLDAHAAVEQLGRPGKRARRDGASPRRRHGQRLFARRPGRTIAGDAVALRLRAGVLAERPTGRRPVQPRAARRWRRRTRAPAERAAHPRILTDSTEGLAPRRVDHGIHSPHPDRGWMHGGMRGRAGRHGTARGLLFETSRRSGFARDSNVSPGLAVACRWALADRRGRRVGAAPVSRTAGDGYNAPMRWALAVAVVLIAFLAPAAHAATVSSLSVLSDARDFIGDGVPRVAYPGGPAVSAGPDPFGDGGIAVGAVTGQEGVGVEIAPPPGEPLRAHNWTMIEDYPFQASGRPGLTVRAGNRACNVATGQRRGARYRLRRAGSGHAPVGAVRPPLRGRALVGVRGGSLARRGCRRRRRT